MKTAKEFWKEKFDEYPQNDSEKLAVAMMQEYAQEVVKNNAVLPDVGGSLHIDFAVYLTGHDQETIRQMYNDWRQ